MFTEKDEGDSSEMGTKSVKNQEKILRRKYNTSKRDKARREKEQAQSFLARLGRW